MIYETPANVVELLDNLVGAAASTSFYRSILSGRPRITSIDEFLDLPITPLSRLRGQRLSSVVTDPARVQWIAGQHKGQSRLAIPVAEGPEETGLRYGLFQDALREAIPDRRPRTCAILTGPEKRYFAAEISTILGYMGHPAHIFIDDKTRRAYKRLHQVSPGILVILSDGLDESDIPLSVELCVTFRRLQSLLRFRQLDLYLVDEFGFLGHSTDLDRWILYNDQYLFERSKTNRLVVTAFRNHTQPLLRLETEDTVSELREHDLKLCRLSSGG